MRGLLLGLALLSPAGWAAIGAADAVNLSGMQRMLSQRIAKLYLALRWQLPQKDLRGQFEQAAAEFNQDLQQLTDTPQNTAAIDASLARQAHSGASRRAAFACPATPATCRR